MSKEVIEVETSLRGLIGGKVKSGMIKGLGTFYQRVTIIGAQDALPRELLVHGIPYEATKTYRVMKSEFERKRTVAMIEAHRQSLLGF